MAWQRLVEFEKLKNGNLAITPNEEGKVELAEDGVTIDDLLEHQLCNGWERVAAEEIGALTDCDIIITDDIERDDDGKIVSIGRVYWHERYQVEDPVQELRERGRLILQGVGN